jgi:hypothetical protein
MGFETEMHRNKLKDHPEPRMLNPYFFGFMNLVTFAATLKQLGGEEVGFYFDHQNADEKLMRDMWDRLRASGPPAAAARIIGNPTFGSEQEITLLQAADYCAWHGRQWMLQGLGRAKMSPQEIGSKQIDPSYFVRWTEKTFDWFMKHDLEYIARKKARLGNEASFF